MVLFMKIGNQNKTFLLPFVSLSPTFWGIKEAEKSFILYVFEVLVKCESKWRCALAIIYKGSRIEARVLQSNSKLRNK